jgi:hypothetical protein
MDGKQHANLSSGRAFQMIPCTSTMHLNPGCCRFRAVQVKQLDLADRELRCRRLDTSSYDLVRTAAVKPRRFFARGR